MDLKALANYLTLVAEQGTPTAEASPICPECSERVEAYGMNIDEHGHVVDDSGNVIVGCEGFYVVARALAEED